jgi:hypothetical protein
MGEFYSPILTIKRLLSSKNASLRRQNYHTAIDKKSRVVHLGDTIAKGNSFIVCGDSFFLLERKREF